MRRFYRDRSNEKSAQRERERRKHCALAVVRPSQKFSPRRRSPSRARGTAKIVSRRWSLPLPTNQFGEDRCMQFRVIVVTDPPTHRHTHTHTHPQTGPITIHCAAASVQCNEQQRAGGRWSRARSRHGLGWCIRAGSPFPSSPQPRLFAPTHNQPHPPLFSFLLSAIGAAKCKWCTVVRCGWNHSRCRCRCRRRRYCQRARHPAAGPASAVAQRTAIVVLWQWDGQSFVSPTEHHRVRTHPRRRLARPTTAALQTWHLRKRTEVCMCGFTWHETAVINVKNLSVQNTV